MFILWCRKSTLAHYLMQSFISLLVAKPNLPLLMARFMVHNLAQIMIQVIVQQVLEESGI
jgi:hypothetical protein